MVNKENIILDNVTETLKYKSKSHPVKSNYPQRKVEEHASFLQRRLEYCTQQSLTQKQVAAIKSKSGMYLEFSGESGCELATKSLENRPSGIRLLNVREEDGKVKATVYVPEGKENYFVKKVNQYACEKTSTGKPKNKDLISSIDDIKLALLEAFWTDRPEKLPNEAKVNCEVWFRYEVKTKGKNIDATPWETVDQKVMQLCMENGILISDKKIRFPERIVKLVYANRDQLKTLISTCEYVTEIRRTEEPNLFFDELSISEQREWIEELLNRTDFSKSGVSVCLLDAGINNQHPLIQPATDEKHLQSVDPSWGTKDNPSYKGHGTEMAGLILYNDLKEALISQKQITVPYELESVKILPPRGQNAREMYGEVTTQAVSLAEIENPSVNRVLCMPVTAADSIDKDGRPTSWSAAIDSITSGANEENIRRLFIVSAGNVYPDEFEQGKYPDYNQISSVQDPAQSWNAVTVGGYTKRIEIADKRFDGFAPVGDIGQLSPYSTTSVCWNKNKWPVKPEVLFDGGNMVSNGSDYDSCLDVSVLTTGHTLKSNLFSAIWGTSSASAQAAYFAANLMKEHPNYWPETIRGLIIHSAEWTPEMVSQFCNDVSKKSNCRALLRTCGYGIPNLERALHCTQNSVNMIIQGELQPFNKKGMNEMHMHTIPWPKEVLRDLGNTEVKIKVTLSYFIEPSPGEVGWKDRYRYPSCGLRFEINNTNQSLEAFSKYINIKMKDNDSDDEMESSSGWSRWFLGKNNRDSGSIHSDFIKGAAVDLCECKYVAVYPVGGWWKERTYLNKYDHKVKYSLIVTVSTPEERIDLYTPIVTQISNAIMIHVNV